MLDASGCPLSARPLRAAPGWGTAGLVARFPIGVPDPSADAARLHLPTAPGQRSPSRVCRVAPVRGVLKARYTSGSDCEDLLGDGGRHPPTRRLLDRQLIVASPEVLDEAVSGDNHPCTAVLLESSHCSLPLLEAAHGQNWWVPSHGV